MSNDYQWWQTGIVYQVYPRSYMDSNGDGIGDLPGITSKLDYLQWLGVNAVWVSPCYPSPMKDFGYDVSNYVDIDPMFGSLADMDRLIAETHARGMKLVLDLVPNHTSDQHPWFLESRSSRNNPKRDWYFWRDGKAPGEPPNNWLANFGGIGWTWDERTEQWYYHAFLSQQPDLNWRNSEVQAAMMDVTRFWLDRGIDGFRVDVMYHMIKDLEMRDNPPNPEWKPGDHPYRKLIPLYSCDQPEVHDIVRLMRRTFDEYGERVIIGEIYLPIERLMAYYGKDLDEAQLPFNFQLLTKPWDARIIDRTIAKYEAALPPGAWPNWVLGNHDRPRVASRVGRGQSRVAAMALLTLRGTPTIYQGDEIDMEDVPIPPDRIQDPQGINISPDLSRDPERTPMQWDDSSGGGFTTADEPWLPVATDFKEYNVARERDDGASMLTLHRRLIDLRQSEDALMDGSYEGLQTEGDLLAYVRDHEGTRFLIALNMGHGPATLAIAHEFAGKIAVNTHLDRSDEQVSGHIDLRGDEGVVVRVGG